VGVNFLLTLIEDKFAVENLPLIYILSHCYEHMFMIIGFGL